MAALLRLATAGSVDDGKSTLIGRLLFDSKAIFDDQLSAVEKTSQSRGQDVPDLALLTDGLRAEREQGITIDVAYRYFATPKRKFIIADTPGHIQYTRNMVTGASTADVALILIDARNGVLEQSRRHAFLATLLGIPHLIVCINKMDLVDFSQACYEEIRSEFGGFATKLEISDLSFIPMSALTGDNVVQRSQVMPWYEGTSLLHQLEDVHIASDRNLIDVRLPVQYVIRPHQSASAALHDFRGYGGTIAGGVMRTGDEVTVLPSGFTTSIKAIWKPGGVKVDEAFAEQAVTLELTDDIDIARGDLLCRPHNRPHVGQEIDAMVTWMRSARPVTPRACTPRPAPARSATSPASTTPTRLPNPRTCGCVPRTETPPRKPGSSATWSSGSRSDVSGHDRRPTRRAPGRRGRPTAPRSAQLKRAGGPGTRQARRCRRQCTPSERARSNATGRRRSV